MKRLTLTLLLAAAGLLAACTSPGSSPGSPGETSPVESAPIDSMAPSVVPSQDATAAPSTSP